jgi:signal transduction histidine kinase
VIASSKDITERKQAEEALRLANRKINLLTSSTRHDIFNRLTVLRARLRHARARAEDRMLRSDIDKADEAAVNIREHLEIAQAYQQIGSKAAEWQHVAAVVDKAQKLIGAIDLSVSVRTGDLEISADPLLKKVFYNLFDNSLRHGKHVSENRVSVKERNGCAVIIWEDNGIGIAAEEKAKIFDEDYGKNTGLGLFLAREILAITGITIRETGEPGKGARFEMFVPKGGYRNIPVKKARRLGRK